MPQSHSGLGAASIRRDGSSAPAVRRPAVEVSWGATPGLELRSQESLSVWDAPPDLDGDGIDDALRALRWDPGIVGCALREHRCPSYEPGSSARVVAFALSLSGDALRANGGPVHRLVGLRRVFVPSPGPSVISGVSFAEFGPAVITRIHVDTAEGATRVQSDILDVYVGAGLDRHAGVVVHHCARASGHAPLRSGALAVKLEEYAPLVWRAALAHPFSLCEAPTEDLDRRLGASLGQGVTVTVTHRSPVELSGRVLLEARAEGFVAVAAPTRRVEASLSGPRDLSGVTMTHGCYADRLEYRGASRRRCRLDIRRQDGPLPGCLDGPSALDPTAPLPLALVAQGDGGLSADLLFSRGRGVFSLWLPADCRTRSHRVDAEVFRGEIPEGTSASPDGRVILSSNALDLWLWTAERRLPVLLNPPGSLLPRGTVRALRTLDATHAVAVISRELVVFAFVLPGVFTEPEPELRIDQGEILRALRQVE